MDVHIWYDIFRRKHVDWKIAQDGIYGALKEAP